MPSIESLGHPLVFKVSEDRQIPANLTSGPGKAALRAEVRALEGMQKETIVYDAASSTAWRMVSDEGPYLNGTDLAPFPLGFYTSGMAFSFMAELLRHAQAHNVQIKSLALAQDNYYTMEGSAIRGDMTAGARPVDVIVRVEADAPQGIVARLIKLAEASSPAQAYMRSVLKSTFSLCVNGRQLSVVGTKPSPLSLHADPNPEFDKLQPRAEGEYLPDIITKLQSAEAISGVEGGAGSSLKAEQKRTLHVHGEARLLESGLKEIDIQLLRPIGSTFRLLSDESQQNSGSGSAPPSLAYLVAGIGFCFMTQLGRYAQIVKHNLKSYRIVQDSAFYSDGSALDWSLNVRADPVDTHVFVDFDESDEAGQQLVKMGQQTCFLHAAMASSCPSNILAQINGEEVLLEQSLQQA